MDNALALLLLFPVIWPFIAKRIWHENINFTEMSIQIVVVFALTWGVWTLGEYGQTADTEIWNGSVVSKDRVHDHYLRSYQCNCRSVSCGKNCTTTKCDTCYEDRYTVDWSAMTTIGDITFLHLDRGSNSVYNEPDPQVYVNCTPGEPASLEKSYVNYVQAVPNSLFHTRLANQVYADKIPTYPSVYSFYKINRVLNTGVRVPPGISKDINDGLNMALRSLGAAKQVNFIVILTEIADPSFRHAVENQWIGGKKNDVTVFVGIDDKQNIKWADVMTFALNSGNEIFHVELREALMKLGKLEADPFVKTVVEKTRKHYDRLPMATFKALENEIDPPTWVIIIAVILAIGGSLGLSFLFHRIEIEDVIGNLFTGKKRRHSYRSYRKRRF